MSKNKPYAEVKTYNGAPTLFLDGKPTFYSALWLTTLTPGLWKDADLVKRYAEHTNIHIYAFDVGEAWCGPGPDRKGNFDFLSVDAKFENVIKADPEARFHLRINLEQNKPWWQELHPQECEITSLGIQLQQSFASRIWREEAKEFLQAFAEHMHKEGMSRRAIAYQVGAGHTGEWCKRNSSMANPCGDYSKPMKQHFQQWLRKKYNSNISVLRKTWGNDQVTFDTAQVPSEEQQLKAMNYTFRDPIQERNVIDYFQCLADLCADLIVEFCDTVKSSTNGMSLAGAFYGYLMEMSWNSCFFSEWHERWSEGDYSTLQRSGHLGLKKVLESPNVDFLVSPYSYGFRGIGGHGPCMLPSESVRHHGKLYIYEEDSRLHTGKFHTTYGRAADVNQSRAILRRNFSYVVTHGQGVWTFPNADDDIFWEIKRFKEKGDLTVKTDRSSISEIAVLVDDESFLYESLDNGLDVSLILHQNLQGLPRIGAPYDVYLLDDFLDGNLKPYKLYIFLNVFHLDKNRRETLKKEIQRDDRAALWIYAPGYLDETASIDNMNDLTGFKFGMGKQPWSSFMHIVNFNHPITRKRPQDLFWGTERLISPHFHLEDEEAVILGQVVYSQGSCMPGFGVKEFDKWTSIYVASPNIPASVLRGIADYACVHIYNEEGDVIYVSSNLLGIHTLSGGKRIFRLPEPVEQVYDVLEEKVIPNNSSSFSVSLKPISSALYYIGDEKFHLA
ncbi:hypothetical protein GF312_18225 [Candidatus Poribacteria bacterium]|nr:hypothetical protein [Candidatus Poribacteria bacterium]